MRKKTMRKKTMRKKTMRKKTMRKKTMRKKTMRKKTMRKKRMRGGYGKGSNPVGKPWNITSNKNGNYYELSNDGITSGPVDPPTRDVGMKGGMRYKKNKKGGFISNDLLPQTLLDTTRNLYGKVNNLNNNLNGKNISIRDIPDPTMQPIMNSNMYSNYTNKTLDLNKLYNNSKESVYSL